MGDLKRLLKKIKLLFVENIYTHKIDIKLDKAIFSFTFDDVPISAATNGREILEKSGATGTYYVSLNIESSEDNTDASIRRFIKEDDIKTLFDNGHNIGCHTFNHLNLRQTSAAEAYKDCKINTDLLKKITNVASIDHFAYPFGMVSLSSKKALRNKYKTLRTTDGGLNVGKTDMTHLRSVSLCSISFDKNTVLKAIDEAANKNAWVIFFSHDINDNPSEWGTSVEDFKWVVEQCGKSSGEILNIDEAYKKITTKYNKN